MDLRTIMNNDAAASSSKPAEPAYPPRDQTAPSTSPSSSYPPAYPHGSPERSSSYGSLQSPYQYQPSHPAPYGSSASRDSFGAPGPYNLPPQQQSPVYAQQRSHSIQSVTNPLFSPTYSSHLRESPPAGGPQAYPPQQASAQASMPVTPRGSAATASAAAPYPRHTPPSGRPLSSGRESHSHPASSPWVGSDAPAHMSPNTVHRISRQDSGPMEYTPRQSSASMDRRTSDESVSPKTALPPHSRQGSVVGAYPDQTAAPQPMAVENGFAARERRSSVQSSSVGPPATHINSSPSTRASVTRDGLLVEEARSAPMASTDRQPRVAAVSPTGPKVKRRRYNEPPIFAQRSVRTKGRCPMIPNRLPPIPKDARDSAQNPWNLRQQSVSTQASTAAVDSSLPAKPEAETPPVNGPPAPSQPPESPQPAQPAQAAQTGSLGPWEPSIKGIVPYEEITKTVCDFLFQHVVLRNDAVAAPAGTSAAGQGAIIEVEAKMGQLVDMDRNERLHLPIQTESVVDKKNTRLRTAFESTMTVAQHRAMNNFLNEAVKLSMPQTKPDRVPLSYAHKKERDTFYEVSPSELSPVIRQNLNPRHKPRVRVTVDQRTGEVLAKIVKCRIADLDVFSPNTCVDWRISVNLEMSYEGDVSNLTVLDGSRGGRGGDRNKDRMSYRHLAYQIDLTQVAKSEPPVKGEFEHELEIECSAAEIRRQGQLAMSGDPSNQYEDLVKGFVDNIRVLARAVPP
ncbi:mRNA triphosphatase CET1 [Aspergillus steynii IBT 23096]|uniref:mRNA-capping enzyme subunit beta n=1 Tax=Aspergillus steynii IBT 23096 TaxID=1392250 RepID=A0A2I2GP13_9EURO|nr:mRNA triphosphatase CET1 [Aspergillus steynii IBT 23096]PLB54611.1 mRNA triphosphatase CET1 [Aspergillus steynii IBT 23096]